MLPTAIALLAFAQCPSSSMIRELLEELPSHLMDNPWARALTTLIRDDKVGGGQPVLVGEATRATTCVQQYL